ncbi:hypothetical protein E2P81_ATG07271 [Venturia nashicola]|uniref:Mso1 N-terminal domain-containing protein n=1 Tax=Venturia nashicola TaxID=86259 RepID=A0A4Z1NVI7_9PEZI|nr:hypothetical protein E6O75_ATG07431 [Venturia nashicola]TLD31781.1 hypothetical protein E2P81_ATG07271 [Venturia nashicola]
MLSSRFLSRNESSQGPPLQQYAQQQGPSASSSFFASILTSTTSKYNNLRRQLISSEADGDTEDDSHISRVLRAYYIEKDQRLPEWLPPDPKASAAAAPVQFVSSNRAPQAQPGQQGQQQQAAGGRWGRGGLSDLWDSGNKNAQPQEAESLRARPGLRNTNSDPNALQSGGGRFAQQHPQQQRQNLAPEPQARPLPSQRAGSYQVQQAPPRFGAGEPSPPTSSGGGTTAQERLKQRLWGAGRSNSPTNSISSATSSNTQQSAGGRNPYADQNSSGGRNPYAEQAQSERGRFDSGGGGRDRFGGSGSQDRQQGDGTGRPVVSANSPWVGGGDAGDYDPYRQAPSGLPNGPRLGQQGQGHGLPSGPRPRRF